MSVCKRCGDPITGKGKSAMCQPCSVSEAARGLNPFQSVKPTIASIQASHAWRRRNVPVTLAGPK